MVRLLLVERSVQLTLWCLRVKLERTLLGPKLRSLPKERPLGDMPGLDSGCVLTCKCCLQELFFPSVSQWQTKKMF